MRDDVQGLQYSCNCVLGIINAQIVSKGRLRCYFAVWGGGSSSAAPQGWYNYSIEEPIIFVCKGKGICAESPPGSLRGITR